MHQYGPTLLNTKVAMQDDLDKFICCVTKLPDASEAIEGEVVQLTQPQNGYVTTHFYRYHDNRWMDVNTSCGPTDQQLAGELHLQYEKVPGTVEGEEEDWATGYLKVWWDAAPDLRNVTDSPGEHVYSVVVRKPCVMEGENPKYPVDPNDGEVIVRAPAGTTYSATAPYLFDDLLYGTEWQNTYCYRLFHVYSSGWWGYVDGPYHQIPE